MVERPLEEALAGLEAGPEATASAAGTPRGASADAASHPTVAALRERFGDDVLHHTVMAGDEHVCYVAADRVSEVLAWLKAEEAQQYDLLVDLTAVDYGGGRPLEVVYQLWSTVHRRALRLKVTLPLQSLEVDSAVPHWKAADWLEREVFDLFGIQFRGHPDLRRILMPETYAEGHPLRKDFPLRGRFSRAEQTRRALAMAVEDHYTPSELTFADSPPAGTEAATEPAAAEDPDAEAAPAPGRPNTAEDWSLGGGGSAAGGAPAPGGPRP